MKCFLKKDPCKKCSPTLEYSSVNGSFMCSKKFTYSISCTMTIEPKFKKEISKSKKKCKIIKMRAEFQAQTNYL